MFRDLDVSLNSEVIAVLVKNSEGSHQINLYCMSTKDIIAEINSSYVPQGPQLSPNGKLLAYFGDTQL